MAKFFYVYVLQSHVDPERFYSDLTDELAHEAEASQFRGKFSTQLNGNLGARKLMLDFLTGLGQCKLERMDY